MHQQPLRVGFIGTGWAQRVQIPMFQKGGLVAQAVASGNPLNAQRVGQDFGIPEVYATWQELIASPAVDLVSITTPPYLHAEMAIAALQAGKHVLCEKPAALNVGEVEAMLAAAQAAPNQLALVDHELRFHPQVVHLRRLLKEGYVGGILTAEIKILSNFRVNSELPWNWWSEAEKGGGALAALGSHLLDLARWLVGRIDAVTGQLQIGHLERKEPTSGQFRTVTADDHAQLLLRFANGAQGSITASSFTPGGSGMELLFVGASGALRLDGEAKLWGMQGEDFRKGSWQPLSTEYAPPDQVAALNSTAFPIGTYYFAQAIAKAFATDGKLPEAATFYDGLAVQRALDAAHKSFREGVWVRL